MWKVSVSPSVSHPSPTLMRKCFFINLHILLNNLLYCHFFPHYLSISCSGSWELSYSTSPTFPPPFLLLSLPYCVISQFGSVLTLSRLSKYCSPWLKSGISIKFPFLYIVLFFLVLMPLFFHWLSSLCFKTAIKCLSLLLPQHLKRGFLGGSVIKNPPAYAGDTCSIPGPGSSHMLWSSEPLVVQLLSQCPRAQEPWVLSLLAPELVLHNKRSCNEKPDHQTRD